MPLYSYICLDCNHKITELQDIRSPAPKCPNCNYQPDLDGYDEHRMIRVIKPSQFVLRGAGWAADNYSKPKKGKHNENSEES